MSFHTQDELSQLLVRVTEQELDVEFHRDPEAFQAEAPGGISWPLYLVYRGHHSTGVHLLKLLGQPNLFEAAAYGLTDEIGTILSANPTLANERSADGHFPLGLACYFDRRATAALLVRNGADVNRQSENAQRVAPIHAASAARSSFLVQMLLENGALPDIKQHRGFVALHTAATNGDLEIVNVLLQAGANPAIENDDGKTPADLAVVSGYMNCAECLGLRRSKLA